MEIIIIISWTSYFESYIVKVFTTELSLSIFCTNHAWKKLLLFNIFQHLFTKEIQFLIKVTLDVAQLVSMIEYFTSAFMGHSVFWNVSCFTCGVLGSHFLSKWNWKRKSTKKMENTPKNSNPIFQISLPLFSKFCLHQLNINYLRVGEGVGQNKSSLIIQTVTINWFQENHWITLSTLVLGFNVVNNCQI